MRNFLRSILQRVLGAWSSAKADPAAYKTLHNMLAETKGGVSQLQQQLGEALSHIVVLRGEIAEIRDHLVETKSGVSQLQAESGETLSNILALRRELAETRAETRSGIAQAQSQLGKASSEVIALRERANGSGGAARHDSLHTLPLQLDLVANGYVNPDSAALHPPGEANALAVHYARLANLVAQHWVARAGSPADPYPDDDLSPEFAFAAISERANEETPGEAELASWPWRQLWADPDCAVFLVLGEGNAANHGEARYTPLGDVFGLDFLGMRCARAQDPLAGASGHGGSIWSRLGDRLIDTGTFRRVLFVPLAIEGASVKDWTPDGPMHRRIALALSRLRKELGVLVLPFSAVLWQQGETEANRTQMSARAYKMHFHDTVADLRANGVFAPVFVACSTFCAGGGNTGQNRPVIRQALLELPDPEGGIFAGPDIDAIGAEGRFDGCHFSEQGQVRCAELWLDALAPRRRLIEKLDTMRASGIQAGPR